MGKKGMQINKIKERLADLTEAHLAAGDASCDACCQNCWTEDRETAQCSLTNYSPVPNREDCRERYSAWTPWGTALQHRCWESTHTTDRG